MNPYYSYPCAAPNYAYAYSATPNHYIQMPRGPYDAPAVVPIQPGVTPGQPYYYPQTPPSSASDQGSQKSS
ncbi:hypothetical protein CcaverHIS002_0504030 [Cutaneotrichosporon cavernicola]|uniref:Uncharacterized protein n=1 Tax=Cutaneotrichosporon cavernicola TaxID=279322 RepID=A0AA48L6I0_9TREE|nr:uncharacterized protein CcaverHIS019_0504580 [Cutaneotrichosporon cavernicola]BEI85002.1 hypothetical protein CcaverHIS002_0504030 [Cutaneotrichosporon cavernicola]BEI92830.1 hypothetical protein CcaverHIS019_0504580 [Cutaneotrichosporon cavernicola]BEJ00606.1 hypothetical protein CcaverHIS631_0504630 [Cutaneotrichosporon cavernicola]BEJ08373.1 hypothetical protein CcaverHIS641_0504580 [Cutaneotrichosporon cavernicola]